MDVIGEEFISHKLVKFLPLISQICYGFISLVDEGYQSTWKYISYIEGSKLFPCTVVTGLLWYPMVGINIKKYGSPIFGNPMILHYPVQGYV